MTLTIDLTKGIHRRIYAGATRGTRINNVSEGAELLFWRLHMVADDFGNFEGEPALIKSNAFPRRNTTAGKIQRWLDELVGQRLIVLYTEKEEVYGHIIDFIIIQPGGKNGRRFKRFPHSPLDHVEQQAGESGGIQGNPGESGISQTKQGGAKTETGPGPETETGSKTETGFRPGESEPPADGARKASPDPDPQGIPPAEQTRHHGLADWLHAVEPLFRRPPRSSEYRADKTSAESMFDRIWPHSANGAGPPRLAKAKRLVLESTGAGNRMAYLTKRIQTEFP